MLIVEHNSVNVQESELKTRNFTQDCSMHYVEEIKIYNIKIMNCKAEFGFILTDFEVA